MFYFDYGCVAFWGLTHKQEQDILRNLVVPCEENPLPPSDVERDEFQVRHSLYRSGLPACFTFAIVA